MQHAGERQKAKSIVDMAVEYAFVLVGGLLIVCHVAFVIQGRA